MSGSTDPLPSWPRPEAPYTIRRVSAHSRAHGAASNRSTRLDGERVKQTRRARGLSRQAVADRSQGSNPLSETTIKRAEQGAPLYLSTARRLAELLDVPLGELLLEGSPCVAAQQPTVAVLPFRTDDASASARGFADGLSDDLITRVSRWWFPVVSRTSTLGEAIAEFGGRERTAKSAEPAPEVTAAELGATYLVDGTVRLSDDKLRVTAELVEAATGHVLWRRRYDRNLASVFDAQDELTAAIVEGIEPTMLDSELRRFEGRDPQDLDAWRQALQGAWHFYRRTAQDNAEARRLLHGALQRDPRMPNAWYLLALSHQQDIVNQWVSDSRSAMVAMESVCSEMQQLYPAESGCQIAAAYLDVYMGRRDAAMDRLCRAIELDPNMAAAYGLYGQTLAMAKEPDRSIEQFETALKLSPRDTERWSIHIGMALAHFTAERYELTVQQAQKATRLRPKLAFGYGAIASAQAHLGNLDEARAAVAMMVDSQPTTKLGGVEQMMASVDKAIAARYLGGLERAGLST